MQVAILLFDEITALDAIGPYQVLNKLPDTQVVFVGETVGPKRTNSNDLSLVADASLTDLPQPDILVIPGGRTGNTQQNQPILDWIQTAHQSSRWTTSVCTGSLILGAAGLLQGLQATTHWGAREELEAYGATYVAQRYIQEGKIVTAAGVSAGIDMALWLAAQVAGEDHAQFIQLMIEYDPAPPFASGSLQKASPQVLAMIQPATDS